MELPLTPPITVKTQLAPEEAHFQPILIPSLPLFPPEPLSQTGFYEIAIADYTPDIVHGLFLCRGDINTTLCQNFVSVAAKQILRLCPVETDSIIWYDECMIRYANSDQFYDNIDPRIELSEPKNISGADLYQFNQFLATMLDRLAKKAANSRLGIKFATDEAKFTNSHTLYGLAQCTPDLTVYNCIKCFQKAMELLPSCCDGKQGGRLLLPRCNIRYELYPFYINAPLSTALPPGAPLHASGKRNIVIVSIVVPIVGSVALLIVSCYFILRKANRKCNALQKQAGNAITTIDSLQFDFSTIEAATNGFSNQNKTGQGGSSVVYKGTLPNGQEIAVKRLLESSFQGGVVFRNEAAVVSRLQHRNLVGLLGFCLEGQEKILVYEYIPNKNLDHFLFDHEKQKELDWSRRYKIIVGIVRGILYLHEESRLSIIHRDIKASNVLLDANMNPKISDFGMAKIFHVDQAQEDTTNVVGTYGYMSPEYAMHGQFSVKSDVFSFGVLVLEIISGKRNSSFHHSHHGDNLLSYAWKCWRNQTPLEFLDPTLRGSHSRSEVIKCIHIGLVCVQENPAHRPSMATIDLMLNSHSFTLPLPRRPTYFPRGRTMPNMLTHEMDSDQSTSTSIHYSINEVSITDVYPR
ncbi:Cysteine-rich receptor-kinase-like protein [Quillaja saponaria]|uniref:Cysteine-rich receptor-kinase-like protein n=1 Tax=Quillaja saponaria TaxID=32244 RepID=A0AAD7KV69_QUISA|nr:Cysteine-rich receptor-kinase-like protein [Quillaja saponaria]